MSQADLTTTTTPLAAVPQHLQLEEEQLFKKKPKGPVGKVKQLGVPMKDHSQAILKQHVLSLIYYVIFATDRD